MIIQKSAYWLMWLLLFPVGLAFGQATSPEASKIDRLYQRFSESYPKLDSRSLGNCYADNALLINHYQNNLPQILAGKPAILADFLAYFDQLKKEKQKPTIEFVISRRTIAKDRAYDLGYYKFTLSDSTGAGQSSYGKLAIVLAKGKGGEWRFLTDTNSTATEAEYEKAKTSR
jgi:ketosteroid isomerase-like protein